MTNDGQISTVKVEQREGFSAVWLIPAIALIFGGWLLYKALSEKGIFIEVQFESASGIVAGKTEVRYKGLTVGVVRNVEVTSDLQNVKAEIEMIPSTVNMLTDKTMFWYVTADISFQGVKGLDTLLSGSYINIRPYIGEDADSQREFIALIEEPDIDKSLAGLHIVLQTQALGSLGKNSPVSFKQIPVGHVEGFKYNDKQNLVDVSVFIKPEYADLVKENSRFWNASGIEVNASLSSGIKINTDSLASIIVGGIAFDNSSYDVALPPARTGQIFELFSDFQSAEMGHAIELVLEWHSGIDVGTKIMYQGLTIGKVESFIDIDPKKRKIVAKVVMNPRVVPYLTEGTEFYVVSAKLGLAGITNMQSLLLGNHIGVRFSLSGNEKSRFNVFKQKPAYKYSESGLHLVLTTTELNSLTVGSGIYYQQQQVGNIQAIENLGPDQFLLHIFIEPQYQSYVAKDSRFWNVSGVKISGGLQSFEVQAQSLMSIVQGGIAFDKGLADKNAVDDKTTQESNKQLAENGDRFTLFSDAERAKQRVNFELAIKNVKGISENTRIMLQGQVIGAIQKLTPYKDGYRMIAGILPEYEDILREKTQFWLVSPKMSLAGLTDTEALFGGSYIAINTGEGNKQKQFDVSLVPPIKHHSAEGLQLTLNASSGSVVSSGSLISYRGIAVGEVDNVSLDENEDDVNINITIDEQYRHLVNGLTRFYNASGVTVSGGLTNFVVKTESADAILKGGISFYNPPENSEDLVVQEGDKYSLYNSLGYAKQAGLAITLFFNEAKGLKNFMKVKYQNQDIGSITKLSLAPETQGIIAVAYLNDFGRKFAVQGTQFWLEQTEIGLVGNKNIGSVIEGGFINIRPGNGELLTHFVAENIAPVTEQLNYGLNIKVTAARLGSVRVGNPVLYRQVPVGEVIGIDLSASADSVDIFLNIFDKYAPLVKRNSQFWNTSGFTLEGGIFSGVSVDVESVESVLAGGIAFATPEDTQEQAEQVSADKIEQAKIEQAQVEQGHQFILHDNPKPEWLAWRAKISLNQ
ncbi:MlaD family protein [Thalassotalea sp. PLHSN55]|uniref:PqiB family protein n=1 Tax=Thalassotalea sp. PLHSN55 TaxID=3435888 RepID=UPI003F877E0E